MIRARVWVAGVGVLCLACGGAGGGVHVSEVLGSTAAEDAEFIELFNPGVEAVDLTGWTIELWDSDAGPTLGTPDGDTPIRLGGSVDGGGSFLLANPRCVAAWGVEPDQTLRENAIENSSYTLVLRDGAGEIAETIFVTDGGEGDTANVKGRPITPDVVIEAEGRFIPPGFARLETGGGKPVYRVLPFSPVPNSVATPGRPNGEGGD